MTDDKPITIACRHCGRPISYNLRRMTTPDKGPSIPYCSQACVENAKHLERSKDSKKWGVLLLWLAISVLQCADWRQDAASLLRQEEGFRTGTYIDTTGHKTTGIGHMLAGDESPAMTKAAAEEYFNSDFCRAEDAAAILVGNWEIQPDKVRIVATCAAFQLGPTRYKSFTKHIAAIRNRQYMQASYELSNSRWHDQTPERVNRLCHILETQ